MKMLTITKAAIVGVCVLVVAPTVHAQTPRHSARQLIDYLAKARDPMQRGEAFANVRKFLQQSDGNIEAPALDSVAEGLVVLAIRSPRGSLNATDAIALFGSAGSSSARKPYIGSFKSLCVIAEQASDVGVKVAALGMMSELANPAAALSYLESVATAGPPRSETEVLMTLQYLSNRFGDAGRRVLARIDEGNKVKFAEPRAWLRSLKASDYRTKG